MNGIARVGPRPPVEIPADVRPIRIDRTRAGMPAVMHIWGGTHAAVTFRGLTPGVRITSNSPQDGVSHNEPDVWVDPTPTNDERTIYFHGWRMPESANGLRMNRHICLFSAESRVIFQVQVWTVESPTRDIPFDRSMLRLFGQSMSVSSTESGIVPYRLNNGDSASNRQYGNSVPVDSIISDVVNRGRLTHLAVNAHGRQGRADIGRGGLSALNLEAWEPLAGRVKFIWFMNCNLALAADFLRGVAQRTGALVSGFSGADRETVTVPNHIEYQFVDRMTHWDGRPTTGPVAVRPRDFFRLGRRESVGNLAASLDFNLVPRPGCQVPPYRGP